MTFLIPPAIILFLFVLFFIGFKIAQFVFNWKQIIIRTKAETELVRLDVDAKKVEIQSRLWEASVKSFKAAPGEILALKDHIAGQIYGFQNGQNQSKNIRDDSSSGQILFDFGQRTISGLSGENAQILDNQAFGYGQKNLAWSKNGQNFLAASQNIVDVVKKYDFKRIAIGGSTGAGKTNLARHIARMRRMLGWNVAVIDPKPKKTNDRKWPEGVMVCGAGYNYKEIADMWARIDGEFGKRRDDFDNIETYPPLLVIIDEINRCIHNIKGLDAKYQGILQEGREYGINLMVMGQSLNADDMGLKNRYVLMKCFDLRLWISHNKRTGTRMAEAVFEGEAEKQTVDLPGEYVFDQNLTDFDQSQKSQKTSDALADRLLREFDERGFLTKSDLFKILSKNVKKCELDCALAEMIKRNDIVETKEMVKKGRPRLIYSRMKNQ
jgi:hypothetical protein